MTERIVFGLVSTTDDADDLVAELLRAGFRASKVSIMFASGPGVAAPHGLLQLAAGVGAFVVAGVGPIVSAGPATVALAAAGCARRGFVRLGMTERDALDYQWDVQHGNVVVCAHCERERDLVLARSIFLSSDAQGIVVTGERRAPSIAGEGDRAADAERERAASAEGGALLDEPWAPQMA